MQEKRVEEGDALCRQRDDMEQFKLGIVVRIQPQGDIEAQRRNQHRKPVWTDMLDGCSRRISLRHTLQMTFSKVVRNLFAAGAFNQDYTSG